MTHAFYARIYSVRECYWILYRGLRSMPRLLAARWRGQMSRQFTERIMLAVTEVNGCEVCSWAHARMALEQGMSPEEVRGMLAGDTGSVPAEESLGIAFAQHYADARGNPGRESWQRIVDTYGVPRSHAILGAIRAMMIGNAYGIAWGAFARRLTGRPVPNSSLPYEAAMLVALLVFAPSAIVHAMISPVFGLPLISFPPK